MMNFANKLMRENFIGSATFVQDGLLFINATKTVAVIVKESANHRRFFATVRAVNLQVLWR